MNSKGVSLVELVSVSAIIAILAMTALPVAHTVIKREKELKLRQSLRTIRMAIDSFYFDVQRFPGIRNNVLDGTNEEGFPEEMEWLVEGVDIGDAVGTKLKYLRRIPVDPFTGESEWDTKSSRDRPGSLFSDGINIFDVHSKSDAVALDGTHYNEW